MQCERLGKALEKVSKIMEKTQVIPYQALIELPQRKNKATLGTVTAEVKAL